MSWGGLSEISGDEAMAMDSDKNLNVHRSSRSSNPTRTDESLGILDMDGLSGFGENSRCSTDHPVVERLRIQRLEALKTLEKIPGNSSIASSSSYLSDSRANKPRTSGLDRTDYVPYRRCESINMSDLIADHTIDVQSMSSIGTTNKISFEPSEITGRSTMCIPGSRPARPQEGYQKSVKEILAQSCAADIRSLSETLPESYDGNSSLPRTEDNIGNTTTSGSFRSSNFHRSSLFSNCRKTDDTQFNEESFTPAELMNSKLAADEMAWEQQYATIPTSNFNQSKKLSPESGNNMFRAPSSDFSIGDFFNKRSERLADMMPNVMSPTKRPAFALVEDSMRFSNRSISSLISTPRSNFDVSTPKIDDKTYSRYLESSKRTEKESTRSDADNSFSLSVSAIASALNDLHTEDISSEVLKRFCQPMRIKSYMHAPAEPIASIDTKNYNQSMPSSSKFPAPYRKDARDENVAEKENWNPTNTLFDTASLSASALDFSDSKSSYVKEMPEKSPNSLQPPALFSVKSRKRSHSSTRLDNVSENENEIPIRRSRSPSTLKELAAASSTSVRLASNKDSTTKIVPGTSINSPSSYELDNSPARSDHTITATDRLFLVDSKSPDCGKYSLPNNYGVNSRSTTSMSNAGKASRCNSQCSNSSEFSHRDGKLPLKATCLEMSWGSVKLRTTVQKPIQIKNTSNKRLVIKAEVSGPGFQIVSTQEHANLMTLQSQECRTIYISFCPTVIGSAAGQLMFLPPYGTAVAQQIICLYGYGGHASVAYHGISKGPVGSAYLPMGELRQLSSPLEMSFSLYNKGPLTGFARIYVDSTGLDLPRIYECIEVSPKSLIIQPEGQATIHVTFRPRREDIKKILKKISDVMTLANMRIICGDDATRQRVRNLIHQMKDTEKSKVTSTSLSRLWDTFPEEKRLDELELLKERSETAFDLLSTLRTYEIAITLNHSVLDSTIHDSFMFPDNDETIMFRTLISTDTTMCSTTNDLSAKMHTDSLSVYRNSVESWSVKPSQLEIDPFDKKTKTNFTVRSNFFVKKSFRTDVNFNHILRCSPTEGDLMPGGFIEVTVEILSNCLPSEQLQIIVFVEKEKIILPVKVKKDKFSAHLR